MGHPRLLQRLRKFHAAPDRPRLRLTRARHHNMESGKLAAAKALDLGIEKKSKRLHFAQLYGMAEALSLGLKNGGFRVSKYLPYGPVEQIIPYLLRRAEENRGLVSTSSFDRLLMRHEIMRRLKSQPSDGRR